MKNEPTDIQLTPGAWHAIQYANFFNIQDRPEYVDAKNLLDLEDCGNAESNAKLMAMAPELLDALITASKVLDWDEISYEAHKRIRETLAKAGHTIESATA